MYLVSDNRTNSGNLRAFRTNRSLSGGPGLGALPAWLQNAIQGALKGTTVVVGTPAGNKTFDLSDPNQVRQLVQMAQGGGGKSLVNVRFTGPGSSGAADSGAFAAAKPLLIGAGLLLALKLFL